MGALEACLHHANRSRLDDVLCRQDKGGNVVEAYTGGSVAATLVVVPGSGALLPSSEVSSDIR